MFVGGGAGGVFAPKEVNTLFRLRSEVEPCLGRTPQPGDFDAPRQAIHVTFKSAYAADFGGLPNGIHCGSDPGFCHVPGLVAGFGFVRTGFGLRTPPPLGPAHYTCHIDTLGHLGLIYLATAVFCRASAARK